MAATVPSGSKGQTHAMIRPAASQPARGQSKVLKALAVLCVLSALSLAIVWVMVSLGGGDAAIAIEKLGLKTTLGGTFALFCDVFWMSTKSFKAILFLLPALLTVIISAPVVYRFVPIAPERPLVAAVDPEPPSVAAVAPVSPPSAPSVHAPVPQPPPLVAPRDRLAMADLDPLRGQVAK